MKTLVLDYSKWRCGGDEGGSFIYENYFLGKGDTCLLNKQKYMCCLGQFSLQLNKELKTENILDVSVPSSLSMKIPLLTKIHPNSSSIIIDTSFSNRAMEINDNWKTTSMEKIIKLRSLLKKYKYKLKVINKKK